MQSSPRDELEIVSCLIRFEPGTTKKAISEFDGKMVITHHRFISSDQEQYYQQKYLLQVTLTDKDEVVLDPLESWIELCAREEMYDAHLDAISCLQSATSRSFHTDQLRSLAQLYIDHGFSLRRLILSSLTYQS